MTYRILPFAAAFIFLIGCGGPKNPNNQAVEEAQQVLRVAVVNYPLAYFAERIGGESVKVIFPCPADEDPAYWSPDAETIALFQQADVILFNGAGYAKWIDRATLPSKKMVDTSGAFSDRLIPLSEAVTHSHGPGGKHEHTGTAFTTWLDLELAAEQANAVAEALIRALPDQEAAFQAALAKLETDLDSLDQRLAVIAEKLGEEPLIFSHPVYQYFERKYDLNGLSVHWEPGEPPNMDELSHICQHQSARFVVWEGEPDLESVAQLKAAGVESLVFDPCGNRPSQGDFLTVMNSNINNLGRSILETP